MPENFEPEVWNRLLSSVKPGDTVADVGTYIGLYTVALAKRVKSQGMIYAFEPQPKNFEELKEHIRLNDLGQNTRLFNAAVSSKDGVSYFKEQGCESHLSHSALEDGIKVETIALDTLFSDKKLDILKIDVEGFEEDVLQGSKQLISDSSRCPRLICIEVHPFAWEHSGTTSESLLKLLSECGYAVTDLDGNVVQSISEYGHVFATKII